MLRNLVQRFSTPTALNLTRLLSSPSTPPPSEIKSLSPESITSIKLWSGGLAFLFSSTGYFSVVESGLFETSTCPFIMGTWFGIMGALTGAGTAYKICAETRLNENLRLQRKIQSEFEILRKDHLFLLSQKSDPNFDLFSEIEKINDSHPLLHVFTHWNKIDDRLMELETEVNTLTSKQETLLSKLNPLFQIPVNPKLALDINASRLALQKSMIQIKRRPEWLSLLLLSNQDEIKTLIKDIDLNAEIARTFSIIAVIAILAQS